MSTVWLVVATAGAATVAIKALGPVLLGGRALPGPLAGVVRLIGPAVLAALVVTQAFGGERRLLLDERALGLAVAAAAVALRAPALVVVVAAAAAAAIARAV